MRNPQPSECPGGTDLQCWLDISVFHPMISLTQLADMFWKQPVSLDQSIFSMTQLPCSLCYFQNKGEAWKVQRPGKGQPKSQSVYDTPLGLGSGDLDAPGKW